MIKVLFLDIDGVINTYKSATTKREAFIEVGDDIVGFNKFEDDCVARLNQITDETGAKIVISSTWRLGCIANNTTNLLYIHLKREGVTGDIIGCTPADRECGYINEHYPDGSRGQRGFEINYWLKETKLDIESFVVLDDDMAWFVDSKVPNIVWVEEGWEHGLQDDHVRRAIEILNRR